ncbi:MAG: hypothetical protein AAGD13_19885 [Pseudomonadota bacterium]
MSTLTISLDQTSISENFGFTFGSVTRGGDLSQVEEISLRSSDVGVTFSPISVFLGPG